MTADGEKPPPHSRAPDGWKRREPKGIPASLGAIWAFRGEAGWRYGVELDESHVNPQGIIHGGILMTFMDHGLSLVAWEAADRTMCSTIQLDSHFLRPVRPPAFIELEGTILRKGSSLIFARGILRVSGHAVMEATGVWSIVPPRPPATDTVR